jgi:hypothetical protein
MKLSYAAASVAALVVAASTAAGAADDARRARVEHRGAQVMPFSQDATMHHFVPTPSGGVQLVLVRNGDPKQLMLVRSHVHKEALAFARGDFADPAGIHGADMPGLHALHAGAARISVRYADVPHGARITYATRDLALVAALHAWFQAQVDDHGAHADMKM